MQSIKSFLPSAAFEYTYVNGKRYELEDLIKHRGEEFVGHEVTDVVMGRPPVFFRESEQGHSG